MTDPQPVEFRFECDAAVAHWEVTGLQLTERFNVPYDLRLELRSNDPMAEPVRMLGAPVRIYIERAGLVRELAGIVETLEDGIQEPDHVIAHLHVVPALMALSQRHNSRIFSELSIVDILSTVLGEALEPYERSVDVESLSAEYPPQEYTVQYRETDLDFAHRLMEEHGIGYHFTVDDGVETMVLFDDKSLFVDAVSLGNLEGELYVVAVEDGSGTREDVRHFQRESQLRPTVARSMVYDWLYPTELSDAEGVHSEDLQGPNGAEITPEREDYDHTEPSSLSGYRTEGLDMEAVERDTQLRRAGHQRDAVRFRGQTTATQLRPGSQFELFDHPQSDHCRRYLVIAVEHDGGGLGDSEGSEDSYTNTIECLPLEVEWRPPRRTPRPRMPSMQTATVVGPASEEIHTDEHGRIKVQFHWDRRKLYNDEASCFMRVVQPWAGNGWGFVFLPRIGMEVAVTFIDGDPDRPVVTGCLYNGANQPPYPLPDEKTKSTIKTESSPGGGGFNELRFEDAAGSEEIFIHAQKDLNEKVLNNMSTSVGVDQSISVGHDQTLTVDNERVKTVTGNETVTVEKDRITTIHGTEHMHIMGSHNLTIDGGAAKGSGSDPGILGSGVSVTGEYNIVATDKFTVTVGASKLTMDTSNITLETSAKILLKVGGTTVTMVPAQIEGKSATIVLNGSDGASVMTLDGDADIKGGGMAKIHQGDSFLQLDGDAVLQGATTTCEGTSAAELKGGSTAKVTGGAVTVGGSPIDLTSDGLISITGGLVKINS